MKIVRKRLAGGGERLYYYHRRTGRPIKGEPGSAEFAASLREAAIPLPVERSARLDIEWLIGRWQASPEWENFSAATKHARRSYLKRITRRFKGALVEFLEREEIIGTLYEWRDELAATPINADNLLNCLSALLTWARKRRLVRHNWVREVERLTPSNHSRAELVWTGDLWERLLAKAEPDERRFLLFASLSAARLSDLVALRWSQFDGEWLVYKPQKTARKTGVVVQLPVYALPPFKALLEDLPRTGERMLVTAAGAPWTASTWTGRMADLKALAFPEGDPGRTFHDIRGTTISRLFNSGCSDAEVAAIDGHVIGRGSMLGRYAQRSRQLAINAYNRWTAMEFSKDGGVVVEFKR